MGVPTFCKLVCNRFPEVREDAQNVTEDDEFNIGEAPNGKIDNLYLDMNGIIHPCAHPSSIDYDLKESEMFENVCKYIDKLIRMLRPTRLLYMAIDGVAPRAKMNQQRARRYRTAHEQKMNEKFGNQIRSDFRRAKWEYPEHVHRWDTNVITPGTEFMDNLTKHLKGYIADRSRNHPFWSNLAIIFSDSNFPGEGEHKIMNFIRSQRLQNGYDPNCSHVLFGADADLIMLGLITHEIDFSILREGMEDKYKKQKDDEQAVQPLIGAPIDQLLKTPLQFLRIYKLRSYIKCYFEPLSNIRLQTRDFLFDVERCIDDFVFMCFLCGNDFLPRLPSLSIMKGSIDLLMMLYLENFTAIGGYLTECGKVNFLPTKALLSMIGEMEHRIFQEESKQEERMMKRDTQDHSDNMMSTALQTHRSLNPSNDLRMKGDITNLKLSLIAEGSLDGGAKIIRAHPDLSLPKQFAYDVFKGVLKSRIDKANIASAGEGLTGLGIGHQAVYAEKYYRMKFKLPDRDVEAFALEVASEYLKGLSWVLQYYVRGCPSWDWYYPFHYAPLACHLGRAISPENSGSIKFPPSYPCTPFQQLMAVLPPSSGKCLPKPLQELMTSSSSPLSEMYPEDFMSDPDGKKLSWLWVILLPFVDKKKLLQYTVPVEKSQLTPEEQRRNSLGCHLLYLPQQVAHNFKGSSKEQSCSKKYQLITSNIFGIVKPAEGALAQQDCYRFDEPPVTEYRCSLLQGAIQPGEEVDPAMAQTTMKGKPIGFNGIGARKIVRTYLDRR